MLKYLKIKNNLIHSTAVINWKRLIIGKNNIIGPYVVLGNKAQHPKNRSLGKIKIGNNNIFNEYCNIHLPTKLRKVTLIGNNNYFMNSSTIDHDCIIENKVVFSSNVILGGNVMVMNGAQLGIRTSVHQNQVIGSYTMIGMNSIITKKKIIEPGFVYYGKPLKKVKINKLSLKRNKITTKILNGEIKRFNKLLKKIND